MELPHLWFRDVLRGKGTLYCSLRMIRKNKKSTTSMERGSLDIWHLMPLQSYWPLAQLARFSSLSCWTTS